MAEITIRSIQVSGLAVLMASSWSIPLGIFIALSRHRAREFLTSLINALMGIPTVTLGLILYLTFSKKGPLGFANLLYNPFGIAIGQALLITPIITSLIISSIEAVGMEVKELAYTLGASKLQTVFTIINEAKRGVVLALIVSFNRAIAELGIALMVGGDIEGRTRLLTTAIALETARGEVELSLALTIFLILIVTALSIVMNFFRRH